MRYPTAVLNHPDVGALLRETGESDPRAAIRQKVSGVIDLLRVFGEPTPPFDMLQLASLLGMRLSQEPPRHSDDAEIDTGVDGRLELRLNPDRPEVRRRFSIGHEIGHTFFPGYDRTVQTRRPKKRDWSDPEDVVEHLCDCAASEFLFPLPWFADEVGRRPRTAIALTALAKDYEASCEATLRRYAEVNVNAVAIVFLEWKLKPTQARVWETKTRPTMLLDMDPDEEASLRRSLRVDYAVLSDLFQSQYATTIPPDKSFPNGSLVYECARGHTCLDGTEWLDLGSTSGTYLVNAVPLPTPIEQRGPAGECMVAVVVWPLDKPKDLRSSQTALFS